MISKQAISRFLNRRLDNWVWMKQLKVEDFLDEYKHYKVKPYFKTEPWLHQHVMFHLGMCNPYFLFLFDMGTGKTKGILDIITQVQREGRLDRALITVNGQITIGSWDKAIAIHSDLHPIIVTGEIEEKWEKLIQPQGDIAVIDYFGLHLALAKKVKQKGKNVYVKDDKKIKQIQKLYNFYNGDESHNLRSTDTIWFSILKSLTETFDQRYLMTGTPMGKNPEDVFAQFYLADRGDTFSDTLGMFREGFFVRQAHAWKGIEYVFDKHKEKLFTEFMQHKSLRYTEDECNDIPQRHEIPIRMEFTSEQREHYLRAVDGVINADGNIDQLENSYYKMRQIVAGFITWKDEYGDHVIRFKRNPKLEVLEELIANSGDSKIVVSYEYVESGKIITDRLTELGIGFRWVGGGSKDKIATVNRFITDNSKRVFVMQSSVGGTGTDGLQAVARYLVFWESPSSPITRKQVIKRVSREGQKYRTFSYDLIVVNSIDVKVLDGVAEGIDIHERLVEGRGKQKHWLLFQ
jgi:SNF2 family DNA or RNA helicase